MKEKTKVWIKIAERDLEAAISLLDKNLYDLSAYHSQQAAEKFLKAFLEENNIIPPRSHNIRFLILKCIKIDKEFEKLFQSNVSRLTEYATKARYPEIEIEISEEDAKEAIEIAKKIKEFVLNKLK